MKSSQDINLTQLPIDILGSISSLLTNPKDILAFGLVNKKLNKINQDRLVWKERCEAEFPEAVVAQANQSDIDWRLIYRKETLKAKFKTLEDVKKKNNGVSALHVADKNNNQESLDHFYELAEKDDDVVKSKMLLQWAIWCRQSLDKIKELAEKYPKSFDIHSNLFSTTEFSISPLFLAVQLQQVETFKFLFNHGHYRRINPFGQVEIDSKLFHFAVECGNLEIVRFLIEQGYVYSCSALYNGRYESPIHTAARAGKYEIVELFLDKGETVDRVIYTRGKLPLAYGGYINTIDSNGGTPLDIAANAGHLSVVKLLLERGASPAQKLTKPLLIQAAEAEDIDFIELLLSKYKVSVDEGIPDIGTALHVAIRKENVKIVKLLLKYGASINPVVLEKLNMGRRQIPALVLAAQVGNFEIMKVLVEENQKDQPTNVSVVNMEGDTALFYAVFNGKLEMVKYLLSKKPTVIDTYVAVAIRRYRYDIAYELNKNLALGHGLSQLQYLRDNSQLPISIQARINYERHINSNKKGEFALYNLALISRNTEVINYFRPLNLEAPFERQLKLWKENINFLKDYLQHEITQVQNTWCLFKSRELHKKFEKLKTLDEIDKATHYDQLVEIACQQLGNKEAMSDWTSRVHKMCKMIVAGEPAENFMREIAPVHGVAAEYAIRFSR